MNPVVEIYLISRPCCKDPYEKEFMKLNEPEEDKEQ